jgi:hypothetical protein
MNSYSLFHVSDTALLRGLDALDTRNATTTAELLAHLAEVDSRRLYAPAGYPSMFAYCVEARHYSEGAAFRRIRAARRARRFPEIFAAVARGRVHLTAVVLLAPYLSRENVRELLEAAAHKSRKEIQRLLAERFPQPDVPTQMRAIPGRELTPASVGAGAAPSRHPARPPALLRAVHDERGHAREARVRPGASEPRNAFRRHSRDPGARSGLADFKSREAQVRGCGEAQESLWPQERPCTARSSRSQTCRP